MKGSIVNTKSKHVPRRALIATILMVNVVMATRISVSRSLHPILRPSPKQNHIFTPGFASKHWRKSHLCPLWSSSFSSCLNSLHKSKTTSSHSFSSTSISCPASLSMAAATAAVDEVSLQDNPLLQDFEFPPFDVIDAKHVRPGIRALLKNLEADLEELEKTVEPSWSKLVEPLEKIMDRLTVVWGMINHLKSVKDTSELRSAIEEVQPEKVKFQLRLGQSKPIYNAFKAIRESPQWNSMSEARKRVVESAIKEAVLNGVSLEDDKRDQFNKIEQELEKLSHKFSENVLDATKKFEKLITDKKEIEGLPATALGLAAQTAVSKGHGNATAENGPWIITLDAPSFMAVMQHARNRALREEVYRAYVSRASDGDLDNTSIIDQVLKLRLEKAKLLGYKNYAEVSMATKMATVEKASELLEKLRSSSWNPAVQDMEELKSFAKGQGALEADELNHWDTSFWSERLRESKFDINEEELRPYFSLPKVMDGLFSLVKKLFGVDVEPADGLAPVWNKDVTFYRVKDASGSPIAYFYFDPYSRPSEKRGGAWMDEVVSRSRVLSHNGSTSRLPVAHMVCNQTPPVGDKPSLMTFREVETVFHEFGHALQHMLTKQDEGLVAGIRGIEWDAVELPSQFMENWCYHRDTLMSIAKHYETGESLPEEVYLKLLAARTFRAGSLSLRQLRFACVDLELHTNYVPGGSESIFDVDQKVSKRTQVLPPLPEDRFLCSFSHIFAGGYAAGYYSYKWAEVLSADAFSAFEDAGLNDSKAVQDTGHRFRETILALGGGKPPLEVFVEFRGREPSPDALLRHNGLLPVTASA
ncbi:putative Oligopeptidase A [Melia azedarach]|uniref:Oligopeptidase A n=2 Tax=Melia azedarach TaxID=155640 RepID=A0ACC1XTM5_MELAZ|nr:putative Oligopeptidase A [Melia azedarach]KAJ4714606.1 putative Oligopeptidase A [Melia azedarach]